MKVTFFVPYVHFSGGIKVVAIYAERLRARGHDVVVVSPVPPAPTWKDRARRLLREGRWSAPPRPSHFAGRNIDLRFYEPFRPIENADVPDADVIIGTWFVTTLWISKLDAAKGAKVSFLQGYENLPGQSWPELDETWRLPFHKIVTSRWLQKLAAESFGDTHASLVHNGVETTQFFAAPRGKQPVPTLGFVTSESAVKGMKEALATIAEIRKRIPNLRVVCFGPTVPRGDLALPAGYEFHHRPQQDTIRKLYAQCDLWLCSSKREGFHLPSLEAMACRCPVVSTRAGGPEDIVEPEKNGILVDVDDVPGLATACCRLLTAGEDEWRKFSDAALATTTRFTWEEATVLFEKALSEACARAARGEIAGGRRS